MPAVPAVVRLLPPFALLLALASPTPAAHAASFTIAFEGTVFSATLELADLVSDGDPIAGTIVLDDGVEGVFTAAANPMFLRNEMLYAGAASSAEVVLAGDTLTGNGGDLALFDSTAPLAGSDSYEATALLDASALGTIAPVSILIALEYPFTGFSVADGDPLLPPPALDPTTVNLFTLTSATGAIAFGRIEALEVLPVPEPASLPLVLAGASALGLMRRTRRA